MTKTEFTKNLKAHLAAEYPETKFSVRLGRCNGWIGQQVLVTYTGMEPEGIHEETDIWEIRNHGYQIEATRADQAAA